MLKCLLAPAALLYKAGVTFRHRLFDWGILKSEKFDIPIVCIGNITVGGTGKTPMAEMVIAYMSQMHNVALLSRGYGRRTKGYREVQGAIPATATWATNRCKSSSNFPIRWSSCARNGPKAFAASAPSTPRST